MERQDTSVLPLVRAACGYLKNAGVTVPDGADQGQAAQYDLAVALYVSTVYNGGEEKLERSMNGIIQQIRDYGGEES